MKLTQEPTQRYLPDIVSVSNKDERRLCLCVRAKVNELFLNKYVVKKVDVFKKENEFVAFIYYFEEVKQ